LITSNVASFLSGVLAENTQYKHDNYDPRIHNTNK